MSITGEAASLADIVESEVTRAFLAYPTIKILQIDLRVKSEQHAGLIEAVARRTGGISAHPVGDQILDRDHAEQQVATDRTGHADTGRIDIAVHRRVGDDFETELEIGMNPNP